MREQLCNYAIGNAILKGLFSLKILNFAKRKIN